MRKTTADCTLGGLLHDIGKVVFRAGADGGKHAESGERWLRELLKAEKFDAVLECVRWHHADALRRTDIDRSSPAYIVYVADNIAAGADSRSAEEGGEAEESLFKRDKPLSSVFNILNTEKGGAREGCYAPVNITEQPPYPKNGVVPVSENDYAEKLRVLKNKIPASLSSSGGNNANSLLMLLEETLSFVPSSTRIDEICDISFYDHSKVVAAAAAAAAEYLAEKGFSDLRAALFENEKSFMDEKAFLLFSCDFSGIQKFIYTVEPEGALKSLRSRSFTLELFMEHIIDELLEGSGLSRANTIYSGGGHAYLLLPNTDKVKKFLADAKKNINKWLSDNFGAALFLAVAWKECSAHDLQNVPAEQSPYPQLFRDLSAKLSECKDSRYDADELRRLNSEPSGGRECRICGSLSDVDGNGRCRWCSAFVDISGSLLKKEDLFVSVMSEPAEGTRHIPLPDVRGAGTLFACFTDSETAKALSLKESCVRTYSKNRASSGPDCSTNLYIGDYAETRLMSEAAENAEGIRRIAVCRADVDNLGKAFISGFERSGAEKPGDRFRYQILSRSAAFSRLMSMFFKYYINTLLECGDASVELLWIPNPAVPSGKTRNASIVYSGGDDIFIVGGWNDIIGAICDIRKAFGRFTEGALTFSAGVGIFREKFPIYRAASITEELVDASKDAPGKDSITLFGDDGHTYHWADFREGVLPKVELLDTWFAKVQSGEKGRGKAFLYRLLQLMRHGSDDKINIARIAYLLTRLEPKRADRREEYAYLSRRLFEWITDREERRKLITAIYLYVYLTRQRSGS